LILLERYNLALRQQEDVTIRLLKKALEASFNRLVRRVRVHLRTGSANQVNRNLLVLQEMRQLIPAIRPERADTYDRLFQNLLGSASRSGINAADNLSQQMGENPRIDVSIPIEAVVNAAASARNRLQRWGNDFAFTSAEIVAKGVAEGRPFDLMVQEMQQRLGVVKSRATAIVRTESLRAYNQASNAYYAQNNINEVMWYATADDRSCPTCAPRAGLIYSRGDVAVPRHPQCRCYLAPWDSETAQMNPDYSASRLRHRREVLEAFQKANPREGKVVNLNRAAVFAQETA
jgi:SPP1 gp7 family putative phage head morphogenesis protein